MAPRVYQHELIPAGPPWNIVERLLAGTEGNRPWGCPRPRHSYAICNDSFSQSFVGQRLEDGRSKLRESWIDGDLYGWFGNNLLPVSRLFPTAGEYSPPGPSNRGKPLENIDGLLAATAFGPSLTVATRNTRHFENLGVTIFDPWKS